MRKIKQIQIMHPSLGCIIVNQGVSDERLEKIGETVSDFSKDIYYYADIHESENGSFMISDLMVIKPESFNVGFIKLIGGSKNYVTLMTNRRTNLDLVVYPQSILSVVYEKES